MADSFASEVSRVNAWSTLIRNAVEPAQPVVLRESAALSMASAEALSTMELSTGTDSDDVKETFVMTSWSSIIRLLA